MARIQALAYTVAQSTDVAQWQAYAEQVLGMTVAAAANSGLYVQMDDRIARLYIEAGAENRYVASGWEVANEADFNALMSAVKAAGIAVTAGAPEQLAARSVKGLAIFDDPSGNRHELVYGQALAATPFVSPIAELKFKTNPYGVGHTVLPSLNFDASLGFFRDVLGFGLSDTFNFQPAPDAPVMRIYFLHGACGRHHSLALAEMPSPSGCVHMMVEASSMTDVGLAHDRMQKSGTKLMATLGQHENDRMTSFYMQTPSNFAIEYGWNGITVDPATHQTSEMKQVSIWGHDFSVGFR